ncbi:hypothetical protein GEMRC1_008299 [Eukaryota sp. GEM-RC1]
MPLDDEALMEIEALEAMFSEHFRTMSPYLFEIDLYSPSDVKHQFGLTLTIHLSDNYPAEVPELSLSTLGKEFSVSEVLSDIQTLAESFVSQNCGPSLFSICDSLLDYLDSIVAGPKSLLDNSRRNAEQPLSYQEKLDLEKLAAKDSEIVNNKILFGTPFSLDAFLSWKEGFLAESLQTQSLIQRETGREFFQKHSSDFSKFEDF